LPQWAEGGAAMAAMTLRCVECGRITLNLNADKKCEECAKKHEDTEYMKTYVVKFDFINQNYTR
jgi:hypothetical protein